MGLHIEDIGEIGLDANLKVYRYRITILIGWVAVLAYARSDGSIDAEMERARRDFETLRSNECRIGELETC